MTDGNTPLDYAPPDSRDRRRLITQVTLISVCALLLLVTICGVVTARTAIGRANRVACGSNLRQIGQAMLLYWQDHHAYPPDLQAVLVTQQMSPTVFTCPASSDVPAQGSAMLGTPRTCSYIYVGLWLSPQASPDAIIAVEDPENHGMDGGNVLFGDGHVEWVAMPYVIQLLNDLQQGINPPSSTTTLTPAQAEKIYKTTWKPLMPRLKSGVWRIPTTAPAK